MSTQPSPEDPIAGLLAPLFAIRSESDLGIGDTRTLIDFIDWASGIGFRLVQLLPINETGNDHSPYNAISSVALDPTTIATTPADLPDLSEEAFRAIVAEIDLDALRSGPVLYEQVKPLKNRLLRAAFARFEANSESSDNERARQFRAWQKEHAHWLGGYALFRWLKEKHGDSEQWDQWDPAVQTLEKARGWLAALEHAEREEVLTSIRFYEYVQWVAFAQWREVKAHADRKGVLLMGDVPIGVSYYGADVFSHPELFHLDWSGGAPPERVFKSDPFTQKWGQNWGVPMYRWEVHQENDYAWWRQRVARVKEFFHLFRVDHILGFFRMYGFPWRPEENEAFLPLSEEQARERTGGKLPHFIPRDDHSPENREANQREGERHLRALLKEVGPFALIGEDLGMVPDYVRPSLAALGIAGFKIPQWEREGDGRLISGNHYQRLSVVTYATHDHPPLALFWEQMSDAAAAGDGHQRWELEQFAAFAGLSVHGPAEYTREIERALLKALFCSHSWIAVVMITDLFGSRKRFNVPGSFSRTNWSERLDRSINRWREDPAVLALMGEVRALIQESGRA